MAHVLTIDELYRELAIARNNGLGKKKIMLTEDDECNGLHLMFFGISEADGYVGNVHLPYGVEPNEIGDYVVLG